MTLKYEIKQSLLKLRANYTFPVTSYRLDIDKVVEYIIERENERVAKVVKPLREIRHEDETSLCEWVTEHQLWQSIDKSLAIADEILGGGK